MKYIIRAVKYFIYVSVILALILSVLILIKVVDGDINVLFKQGYKSLGEIAIMFAIVSAIYPKFGYTKRTAIVPGEFTDIKDEIVQFMDIHNYVLENCEGENLTFRYKGIMGRLNRMFEDRITFTRSFSGFEIEGLTKDVSRIAYGLNNKFHEEE